MPQVSSTKHFNRLVSLVMRLYNSVRMIFETAPEKFSPVSYVRGVEGKTCPIVDEWCSGFLHEITLADNAWQPLLDDKPGILRSFQLFTTPEGWAQLDAAEDEAAMHAEWSSKIEPTVQALYAYWLA